MSESTVLEFVAKRNKNKNAKFSKEEHEAALAKHLKEDSVELPECVLVESNNWKLVVRMRIYESSVEDGIGLNTSEEALIIKKRQPHSEFRFYDLLDFCEMLQALLKEYPSGPTDYPWGVASIKYPGTGDDEVAFDNWLDEQVAAIRKQIEENPEWKEALMEDRYEDLPKLVLAPA